MSDWRGEGVDLGNLGDAHAGLGQTKLSIEYYELALTTRQEIGDRRGEAFQLRNMGEALIDQGYLSKAMEFLSRSMLIADDILDVQLQNEIRYYAAVICLLANDLAAAQKWIEQAGQYDWPTYNTSVFALSGIICLRQGQNTAKQAFQRAVEQADSLLTATAELYLALDAEALAFCGLALIRGQVLLDPFSKAAETYRKARAVNRNAGVVRRSLWLFDQLAMLDGDGRLARIRRGVEEEL
jgi:tetratricopeptide (TPR) repeat protein